MLDFANFATPGPLLTNNPLVVKPIFSVVSSLKRFKVRRILEFLTHSQEHINIDVLALDLNVQCQMIFTTNTYSWSVFRNLESIRRKALLKKITSMWGVNLSRRTQCL